jgi:AcrR family transcriptional regulator
MPRHGGRPARIDLEAVRQAGRAVGLRDLSMNAVAAELGVTSTALYRHVSGRWDLERLVGESILADLSFRHDPEHTTAQHLISFALQLRAFTLEHPGLAAYVQLLFPRGDSGRRLLSGEVRVLVDRGYRPDTAIMLHSAVASLAIGLIVGEEQQLRHGADLGEQQSAAEQVVDRDHGLALVRSALPTITAEHLFRASIAAAVRGLLTIASPDTEGSDLLNRLDQESEGL